MSDYKCPACDAGTVKVDYRIAVPDGSDHVYPAWCESCGASLGVVADPGDVAKMVKVRTA